MAATVRAISLVEDDNGPGAPLTQTVPTGTQDNDVLLWFVNRDETTTTRNFPAGWTKLGTVAVGGDGGALSVAYRLASSEPASYDLDGTNWPADWAVSAMVAIQDAATVSFIDDSDLVGSGGSSTSPWTIVSSSVTTTEADTLLIWCGALDNSTSQSITGYTAPTDFTEIGEIDNDNWCSLSIATKAQATATTVTVNDGVCTGTGSAYTMAALVAVKSAGGGGGSTSFPPVQSRGYRTATLMSF